MSKSLAVLAVTFAVFGLAAGDAEARVRCTRDYAPVCARGAEGARTFNNRNCARAEHARILHAGRCRRDIEPYVPSAGGAEFCLMVDNPVCATRDGVHLTFPNICIATTAGAEVVHWGRCDALWPLFGIGVIELREEDSSGR